MDTGTERRNLRKAERHAQILLELRLAPHVRVSDLAASFDVTTETVRRDIAELSAQGLLQKSYGGASPARRGRKACWMNVSANMWMNAARWRSLPQNG